MNMREWRNYILSCIWCPLFVVQIILVFIFGIVNAVGLDVVMDAGCGGLDDFSSLWLDADFCS